MQLTPLTFKSIRARAVVLKLRRPVVARIATITEWPLILIDLSTEEGIVGRSYLEPLHYQDDAVSDPGPAGFWRHAQGPTCRTGRALRSRTQVAAFCRLSGAFHDRGGRTGYGGLGCPGKGEQCAALRFVGRFGGASEGIQQQRVVASGAGGSGGGSDRIAR